LKVDIFLYSNVFGESVLNDAVAIVLYQSVYQFKNESVTVGHIFAAIGTFTYILVGSFIMGVIIGLISAWVTKHLELNEHGTLEAVIVTIFGFSSYYLGQGAQLSGIIAVLSCGMTMSHYTHENLSPENQQLTRNMYPVLASLTETMVFLYLGLSVFAFEGDYDIGFIGFGLLGVLISRAFNVFPLTWLVNLGRKPNFKINLKYQFFMWFAGLRGGIAFVLSRETPGSTGVAMFSTTLMIAFFTVFIEGGATIPLLRKLKIPINENYDEETRAVELTKYEMWFQKMDIKYGIPNFTKSRYQVSVQELEMGEYSPSNQGSSPGSKTPNISLVTRRSLLKDETLTAPAAAPLDTTTISNS